MRFKLDEILKDHLPNYQDLILTVEAESILESRRWETLLTKEPETIEWIKSFACNSEFIDLGANIGVYTLAACFTPAVRIVAFEPFSAN